MNFLKKALTVLKAIMYNAYLFVLLKMDKVMSRYACSLYRKSFLWKKKLLDDNCVIGYDEAMQTFFFQSGQEDKYDQPLIWLGVKFQEYKHVSEIEKTLKLNKLILNIEHGDKKMLQSFK